MLNLYIIIMTASEILQRAYNIKFNNLNILECGAGAAQETKDFWIQKRV